MLGENLRYKIMSMTKFFRFFADTFFAKRYGQSVVLETIAGVPGMHTMWLHSSEVCVIKNWIRALIRELLSEPRE